MLTLPDRHDNAIPSLKQWLQQQYGEIFVVHRLDKDTSGAMIWATSQEQHQYFSQAFEDRVIEKIYHGLVHGQPPYESGLIEVPIAAHPANNGRMMVHAKGKASKTGFKLLEQFSHFSWVAFKLYTGRTHQIRVHAQHAGMPLVCDPLYSDGKPFLLSSIKKKYHLGKHQEEEKPILNRTALHASTLSFNDENGNAVTIEAPIPKDLKATLQQLRKWNA